MNRISVTYNGFKIDCEETNLKSVLEVLNGIEAKTTAPPPVEAGKTPNNVHAGTPSPVDDAPPSLNRDSLLMKLMNKWNRLHTKEVSVRGRRFTPEDKALLAEIAMAATDEEAAIGWVARTIRVCASSIHRAREWDTDPAQN